MSKKSTRTKVVRPIMREYTVADDGVTVVGTSRNNGAHYINTKQRTPGNDGDPNAAPGSDPTIEAVGEPLGVRAWKAILSDRDLLLGYVRLPLQPEQVAELTRTIHANSAEEAAARCAALDDAEMDHCIAEDGGELWISVTPADEPDAEPRLFRVVCRLIPEYVCVEASEADLQRYQEQLAYEWGWAERTSQVQSPASI